MHRRPLLDLLSAYAEVWPDDRARTATFADFVRAQESCFLRTCVPGHVTGSAWIVSSDRRRCLLTHHRKLDKWLQLGGHADGDPDVVAVALREAREESGMDRFLVLPVRGASVPLDIDVHRIPANGHEPAHDHYDVRFLLEAVPGQAIVCSKESKELTWVDVEKVHTLSGEESLLRLNRRAQMLLEEIA